MDKIVTTVSIMNKLNHAGAGYRIEGLKDCVVFDIKNADVISKIKELKNDDVVVLGWSVGQLATVVLDVLGIEKYKGNDPYMVGMIENLPAIFEIEDNIDKHAS